MKTPKRGVERDPGAETPGTNAGPAAAQGRPAEQEVLLSQIEAVTEDHRARRPKEAIQAMAASLRAHGQRVPIVVAHQPEEAKKGLRMIDGETRRQAALSLGWDLVLAHVWPAMDDVGLQALRVVLNLDRLPATPVDECRAVLATLHAVTGRKDFGQGLTTAASVAVPAEAIQATAAALGRSAKWVRDRLVLARLGPHVRDLVASGRLGLGHARLIAKVADGGDQEELAQRFSAGEDGPREDATVEDCRQAVLLTRRAIRGTRFDPAIPYAGRPACVGCPHNSAAVNRLFQDAGDKALEDGCCMLDECFQAKARAAEEDLRKAVAKAVKRKLPPTAAGVRPVVPEGLKAAAVARQVAKAAPGPGGGGGAAAGRRAGRAEREPTPEERLREALRAWSERTRNQIAQALRKAFGKDRRRWAAWRMAARVRAIDGLRERGPAEAKREADAWRAARPVLRALADGKADLEEIAAEAWGRPDPREAFWQVGTWSLPAVVGFAEMLGLKVAPPPTLQDFSRPADSKIDKSDAADAGDADCDHECGTCSARDCEDRA